MGHLINTPDDILAESAIWHQKRAAQDYEIGQTCYMPDDLEGRAKWQRLSADASAKARARLFALIERSRP